MEVTPEIYAWLTELKILKAEKTLIMKKDGILIDDSVSLKLINGFYWDKILNHLENLFNKFYKIKLNYALKLEEIKPLLQQIKGNSFDVKVRLEIWNIIGEVIRNFGVELNEDNIKQISNGKNEDIKNILITINLLTNQLTKTNNDNNFNSNNLLKSKADNSNNNSMLSIKKNFSEINKSKSSRKLLNSIDLSNMKNSYSKINNNSNNISMFSDSSKINQAEKLIEKKTDTSRMDLIAIKKSVNTIRKHSDTLDINSLIGEKRLEDSESPLEFFILTLTKNLELRPRQAIALLSNNRKYLIQISNRGIKGNYKKMLNWYQDVVYNYHNLLKIINSSQMKDTKSMTYAILSVGLYSKSSELAEAASGKFKNKY
jgi:hypothetical protein